MTNAKRGRSARRAICLCAIAALGIALSGCGGGSSGAAAAADSTAPAQGSTSDQSTSAGTSAATGETVSGSTPSRSTGSGSTTSGSGASRSTTSAPSSATGDKTPPASDGDVTLNWIPPTENTDGTALTNLAGYNIHYGTASHRYTRNIPVDNPGIARYVVEALTPGRYYFSVAAVNTAGTESPMSSEVSATVN